MKKVLVTGVNGFVGLHVAKEFADNGFEVVGVGGPLGSAQHSQHITHYNILDLLDKDAVKKLDLSNIDAVVHLAGLAAVGPSFEDPLGYITTNIGIGINLFERALQQEAKPKFLIISSGALYDPKASLPLTERSPVIPSSPYAVSKLGQEQMTQYYSLRGFKSIIARPFNHIGPGQNEGFIVPDLAKQAVDVEAGRAEQILVGNLDAQRDYTDVRDIARAYRLLIEHGHPGEVYNVCSGVPLSGHEILATIMHNVSANPPIEQDPSKMRPSDTPIIYGDHSKITQDTGWQPQISLETTINDAVADWRSRSQQQPRLS